MTDKRDYSLLRHNTFGIEARCRRFIEYDSVEEAKSVAALLRHSDGPFMLIGAGSNLLLTRDYEGTIVHSRLRGISLTEDNTTGCADLCCGSGETWDDVVAWTAEMGFADLVNLSHIPGEVGASAVQNIGAYGAEAAQTIASVRAVEIATGRVVDIDGRNCGYAYRNSRFKHEWRHHYLITHVTYRLQRGSQPKLDYADVQRELDRQGMGTHPTPLQLRQIIISIRQAKLPEPSVKGNAGSFFMNPVVSRQHFEELLNQYPQMPHYHIDDEHEKIPAAWLIDQCGWKGRSMGRAGVHDRQALVLVNMGGATGSEVVTLCRAIQHDVEKRFGISLTPEVNIV